MRFSPVSSTNKTDCHDITETLLKVALNTITIIPNIITIINVIIVMFFITSFDIDPTVRHTVWNLVIGCSLRMLSLTFNQSTVQRISSMATQRDANRSV